jgi:hypothetical protein
VRPARQVSWYNHPVVKLQAISCVTCGAPLRLPAHKTRTICPYCERELSLERSRGKAVTRDTGSGDVPLAADLLRGWQLGKDVGSGRRYDVAAMREREWRAYERGVWPVSGRASSQFGGGWNASVIAGAPRVYPRSGDRMGAWAPRNRDSKTEWVEAIYPAKAPPVKTVRVFETCVPGATFAVTATADDGTEELIWYAAPRELRGAQVLEIPISPPRKLSRVRAYVDNTIGWNWSEIDTIGLIATEPVPRHLRRRPAFLTARGWTLSIIALVLLGMAALMATSGSKSDEPPSMFLAGSVANPPDAPGADGAFMEPWFIDAKELPYSRVVWASSVHGASSEYGSAGWSAGQARGAPNVYPRHGDVTEAWATRAPDGGTEWIEVAFELPDPARGLVLVETFNPGAVVRVDDLSDRAHPVTLWRGTSKPTPGRARLLRLTFARPRTIERVRVVLDTRRVKGWNEIDAIGLLPAR